MNIHIEHINHIAVVQIAGELDSNTAPLIQQQVLPLTQKHGRIVLDMSKVTYMSSAGLRMLLLVYRQMRENVGYVVLAGLSEEVRDVMAITGFLDCFTTFDSLSAGISALAA